MPQKETMRLNSFTAGIRNDNASIRNFNNESVNSNSEINGNFNDLEETISETSEDSFNESFTEVRNSRNRSVNDNVFYYIDRGSLPVGSDVFQQVLQEINDEERQKLEAMRQKQEDKKRVRIQHNDNKQTKQASSLRRVQSERFTTGNWRSRKVQWSQSKNGIDNASVISPRTSTSPRNSSSVSPT